jgi:hypothetical protein
MMMWPWPDGDPFGGDGRRFPALDNPDVRLTYEVVRRLQADRRTRAARITVEVQNGVVILDGAVGDAEVKQLAADTARDTPGVRDVCDALRARAGRPESPGPPGAVDPAVGRSRTWAAVAAALVTAWVVLLMIILMLGWIGVIIGCLCAAVTLEAVRAVRGRRRTGHAPTDERPR